MHPSNVAYTWSKTKAFCTFVGDQQPPLLRIPLGLTVVVAVAGTVLIVTAGAFATAGVTDVERVTWPAKSVGLERTRVVVCVEPVPTRPMSTLLGLPDIAKLPDSLNE